MSEDFSIRVVGLWHFVTLCKTAPYRNSLTYLLTYLPFVISSYLCFDNYDFHENFEKYIGGVVCCEYRINGLGLGLGLGLV